MKNIIISDDDTEQITWAPKVKPSNILRLYQTDALRLIDEDLITMLALHCIGAMRALSW